MKKVLFLMAAILAVACTAKSSLTRTTTATIDVTVEVGTDNIATASLTSNFAYIFNCDNAALQSEIANSTIQFGYMKDGNFVHYAEGQANLQMPFDENGNPAVADGQKSAFYIHSAFPWTAVGTQDYTGILEMRFEGSESSLRELVGKTVTCQTVYKKKTDNADCTYTANWNVSFVDTTNVFKGTAKVKVGGTMQPVEAEYDSIAQYLGYADWSEYAAALNAKVATAIAGDADGYRSEMQYYEGQSYSYGVTDRLCTSSDAAYYVAFDDDKFNIKPADNLTTGNKQAFVRFDLSSTKRAYLLITTTVE